MLKQDRARHLHRRLDELYPETPIPLDHRDAYTLLIAVLLSAQCTDVRVNQVTPALFALADNPRDMMKVPVESIRGIIRPCGLSPRKSLAISELSKILVAQHGGEVPAEFAALEALPGVGHKTASVVMAQAFGVPAFPVDTHIHRLAQVWGLSDGRNVQRTEADLKSLFPENTWNRLHLQIIYYGREICQSRQCDRLRCALCQQLFPDRKTPFKAKKP
jgi:endonuclease-3